MSLLSWISICVSACYFGRQITFAVGKISYWVSIFLLPNNITKTIYLKERVNTKEELYHLNVGMCRLPFCTSQEKVWILKKDLKISVLFSRHHKTFQAFWSIQPFVFIFTLSHVGAKCNISFQFYSCRSFNYLLNLPVFYKSIFKLDFIEFGSHIYAEILCQGDHSDNTCTVGHIFEFCVLSSS